VSVSDLPVTLPDPLARRLAAALDVEGKIPRALEALGPLSDRDVAFVDGEPGRFAARLAELGLPAAWRLRRTRGVVTWKSGESVGTFLRRIGAGAALLELEARQVSRALRGELNRVLNAESANLQRAVAAAGRQLEAIDRLEADGRLAAQPRVVRAVAAARRETPEATLADLAARLELHRSAVQRALERLERLALHEEDGTDGTDRPAPRAGPVGTGRGGTALA